MEAKIAICASGKLSSVESMTSMCDSSKTYHQIPSKVAKFLNNFTMPASLPVILDSACLFHDDQQLYQFLLACQDQVETNRRTIKSSVLPRKFIPLIPSIFLTLLPTPKTSFLLGKSESKKSDYCH
jgi:hypothetical protein